MSDLISILKKEIPNWLKDSIFYRKIETDNENKDVFISIQKDKFENEIKINNIDDLYKYLEIVRYWMVIDCPHEIYDYLKLNQNIINLSYIKEKFYDLPFLDEFKILCSTINKKKTKYFFCREASKKGYLNLLKYANKNGYPWNESTCTGAATNGHFKCLKYAYENGCPWTKDTCDYAALNGHSECLEYAYENECPRTKYICEYAAKNRHFKCLKYLIKKKCPGYEKICKYAAENGDLECLKCAYENGCPLDEDVCFFAAHRGGYFFESLKNAHEKSCHWDKITCSSAADRGYFNESLKCANNKQLECLKYLINNKCPGYEKYIK